MSSRTLRLNELIQRELSDILHRRYQAEAVALTISEVRVAPDLRDARVFIAVVGEPEAQEEKLRWLRRLAPAIRQELARRITIKFLPKFEYVLDRNSVRANRVLGLLDQIEGPPRPEPDPDAGDE